jgi:hypothetical protein
MFGFGSNDKVTTQLNRDGTLSVKDSGITAAKAGSAVVAGVTTGLVAAKVMASLQVEALLDTSTNNLFAVEEGDVILDIVCYVGTAAGSTCTVNIGIDAAALGATTDPNGLIEAADFNAVGVYLTADTVTDATEPTYVGDVLGEGPVVVDADGYVTLTSSHDLDEGAYTGKIVMYYIPA